MKAILNPLRIALALAAGLQMAEPAAASEGKKVKFCDKDYDLDTLEVFFKFGNGEELVFDTKKCSEEIRTTLMLHGASQKIGDSFAGAKGNFVEGIQSAKDVIEQLYAGAWQASREGDARPRLAELAEAIARIKGVPLDAATAAVEKGTDEQRKAWRSNARVKLEIQKIRTEKAAAALEAAAAQGEKDVEIEV